MLGCGLVVGQLFLVQEIGGSNPPTPATHFPYSRRYELHGALWRNFKGLSD
jgi:hypothetical protein